MALPNDSNRVTIIGSTGSGKTQAGVWHLSLRSWQRMPWVVVDYKRDKLLAQLPWAGELSYGDRIPKKPGLYVIHPHPDDTEEMDKFLTKVWEREKTGLLVDEAMMLGQYNGGFKAILTQGRSKTLPVIALTQRPVSAEVHLFTDSEYYQLFRLNTAKDERHITNLVGRQDNKMLPDYHSVWYDVVRHQGQTWKPVTKNDVILENFHRRSRPDRIAV